LGRQPRANTEVSRLIEDEFADGVAEQQPVDRARGLQRGRVDVGDEGFAFSKVT
jgi:hypothetical protein